jgi:hypothetical protein
VDNPPRPTASTVSGLVLIKKIFPNDLSNHYRLFYNLNVPPSSFNSFIAEEVKSILVILFIAGRSVFAVPAK